MIGDGFCQDYINNELCIFDGGDCCRNYVEKTHCSQCTCHETSRVHIDPLQISKTNLLKLTLLDNLKLVLIADRGDWYQELSDNQCVISWLGDGICQKVNNHVLCHFDGGDCCVRTEFSTKLCSDCVCLHGSKYYTKTLWILNYWSMIF